MSYKYLESDRLVYRRFTDSDYNDLHEIMGNESVRRFLPGNGAFSEKQSLACLGSFRKSFSADIPDFIYALVLKDTNKVIGYAGVAYIDEYDKNEIMYGLNENYWCKGYASEAAFRMLELGKYLDLETIIAFTHVKNLPSEKVILKIGYTYIKTIDLWGLKLKYYEQNLKGDL